MRKVNLLFIFLLISYAFAGAEEVCTDEGSHSDDWWFVPDLNWFEILVGATIIIFTFIATAPQIFKIIKRRSSEGVSAEYIFFLAINQIFSFTNSTIFNYPYMESCPHVGYDVCIPALLTWGHIFVSVLVYFIMFTSLFVFFENKSGKRWYVVIGYYIFYIAFIIFSVAMISLAIVQFGNCSTFSQTYAKIFGVCAMIVTFIQYLPQLWTTFRMKTSGSLSLFANIIQVGGFVVIICFMGFVTKQNITSLLGFMVSLVLQSVLTFMQLYYDYIPKWLGKKKADGETQALITNDEETNENKEISEQNEQQIAHVEHEVKEPTVEQNVDN